MLQGGITLEFWGQQIPAAGQWEVGQETFDILVKKGLDPSLSWETNIMKCSEEIPDSEVKSPLQKCQIQADWLEAYYWFFSSFDF